MAHTAFDLKAKDLHLSPIQAAHEIHGSESDLKRIMDLILIPALLLAVAWSTNSGWQSLLYMGLFATFTFQCGSTFNSLYGDNPPAPVEIEVKHILTCWSGFVALLCAGYIANMSITIDGAVIAWVLLTPLVLILYRWGLRRVLALAHVQHPRRVGIIGATSIARRLVRRLADSMDLGLEVERVYYGSEDDDCLQWFVRRAHIVRPVEAVLNDVRAGTLDSVFICEPLFKSFTVEKLVERLSNSTVDLYVVPSLDCYDLHHARYCDVGGVHVIGLFDSGTEGIDGLLKRAEDIVLSCIILALIAFPMLLIALAIKITMPGGPVIFRQRRYGVDGKEIEMWKFRSMTVCEDSPASVKQATVNDSRITPLGSLLRKTSLDELPQFINVLLGDMSIVGPRPHAVAHNELYREKIPGYMLRHKVKPGITGLAQIRGFRGETDTVEKMFRRVEADAEYIRTWSIWLDLKIIFKTLFVGFVSKNAR